METFQETSLQHYPSQFTTHTIHYSHHTPFTIHYSPNTPKKAEPLPDMEAYSAPS